MAPTTTFCLMPGRQSDTSRLADAPGAPLLEAVKAAFGDDTDGPGVIASSPKRLRSGPFGNSVDRSAGSDPDASEEAARPAVSVTAN